MENLDGKFSFGSEELIYSVPSNHSISRVLNFEDWDSDADIDIILNVEVANNINQIQLLRNDGNNSFSAPEVLIDSFPSWDLAFTQIADVDNDDDLDVVVHSGPSDIWWYRNEGTGFSAAIFIHEYFDVPSGLELEDINNDGLLDIFWCGHGGLFWKENRGGFTFDSDFVLLNEFDTNKATNNITFGDLDLDGDLDILRMGRAIGTFSQRFSWYKNTYPIVLDTEELTDVALSIYPNPVVNWIQIKTEFPIKHLQLYNSNGTQLRQSTTLEMNVSNLTKGLYFLHIELKDGRAIYRPIMKI